jgi:hypothetical protein
MPFFGAVKSAVRFRAVQQQSHGPAAAANIRYRDTAIRAIRSVRHEYGTHERTRDRIPRPVTIKYYRLAPRKNQPNLPAPGPSRPGECPSIVEDGARWSKLSPQCRGVGETLSFGIFATHHSHHPAISDERRTPTFLVSSR